VYSNRSGQVQIGGQKIRRAGKKLREQEARETQEKEEKARLEGKKNF